MGMSRKRPFLRPLQCGLDSVILPPKSLNNKALKNIPINQRIKSPLISIYFQRLQRTDDPTMTIFCPGLLRIADLVNEIF